MADNSIEQTAGDEVKVAAGATPVTMLSIPRIYAKYVDDQCWQLIDCKKSPGKEYMTYLLGAIETRFIQHLPSLKGNLSVKMETAAQVQILLFVRILAVSALTNGFCAITYGTIGDLCEKFHIDSIERDAWNLFAGILGRHEKCVILQTIPIPQDLLEVAEKIILTENIANSLPGASIRSMNRSDRAVECVLTVVANTLVMLIFDFWSASVDLEGKTSIKITSNDINGIFRIANHSRIPAQYKFLTEFGNLGNQFVAIKKHIKQKDAHLKPKSGRGKRE